MFQGCEDFSSTRVQGTGDCTIPQERTYHYVTDGAVLPIGPYKVLSGQFPLFFAHRLANTS